MSKQKRILIIRTDRIGDVLLSTPAIRLLRKTYPDAHIALIVRPYTYPVVKNNHNLDEVIVYDKYHQQKGIIATIKFAFAIRKKKFDQVFILHPTNRAHWIAFLAGIKQRIGFSRKASFLLTDKVEDEKHRGDKHETQYIIDLITASGIKVPDNFNTRRLILDVSPAERDWVKEYLANKGIGKEKIIIINPLASCRSKIWPKARFKEVSEKLTRHYGETVRVITIERVSEFSLGELSALLEKSVLLISNDSAPVHIAVALSIPVVDIFGRSDPGLSPRRWGPLGKDDIILHKDAGCVKCRAHNCDKDFECLKAITVDEVYNAAIKILRKMSLRGAEGDEAI